MAHQPLFQGGQQRHPAGLSFRPDQVFNGADYFRQLVAARAVQPGWAASIADRDGLRRSLGVNVHVVEDQPVHLVGQAAGGAPGHADYEDPLPPGAKGVDDVDEVGVPGDQDVCADVGVGVSALNAIGGHLDVDAVLNTGGPVGVRGRSGQWKAGWDINRIDPGGVKGRRVEDELARSPQFGRPGHPISVGFGDYDASVVGYLLLERGNVGVPVPAGQADLEVLPIDKKSYVVLDLRIVVHASAASPSPSFRFQLRFSCLRDVLR